tara:strand:+ start:1787 stop:2683 length:897 start_codon:yes stop_codon:yes gene_type:complete
MSSHTALSYCLFEPITVHPHRTWDEDRLDKKRYWYNIPALYITNKILYPDYDMVFYVTENLKYHPLYSILNELEITIKEVNIPFDKTSEPMLWRLMSLWENYDCVFTRDVDSIPNRNEFLCTEFFKNSEFAIQTIRSHENHYHNMGCDMLGGLSGFKPQKIEKLPSSFEEYYSMRSSLPWAQDQLLMVNVFVNEQSRTFLEKNFLDCPIDNQNRKAVFLHTRITEEKMNSVTVTEDQENVLRLIEELKLTDWAGEPSSVLGENLNRFLELDNEHSSSVKKLLDKNRVLKEFYYENIHK